jgi:hypothetical protein
MLSVVMLNVVMLNVVKLSVVGPFCGSTNLTKVCFGIVERAAGKLFN